MHNLGKPTIVQMKGKHGSNCLYLQTRLGNSTLISPHPPNRPLQLDHLTFSPLVFESSFSFFLAAATNSLNNASLSFIFSIALNLESLACLAANSLKVAL